MVPDYAEDVMYFRRWIVYWVRVVSAIFSPWWRIAILIFQCKFHRRKFCGTIAGTHLNATLFTKVIAKFTFWLLKNSRWSQPDGMLSMLSLSIEIVFKKRQTSCWSNSLALHLLWIRLFVYLSMDYEQPKYIIVESYFQGVAVLTYTNGKS